MSIIRQLSLLLALCMSAPALTAPSHSEPAILLPFNPAAGELPESLTIDRHGNLYVAFAGSASIAKLTPELELSVYAALPVPEGTLALGVKVGPDDCLYSLSGAFSAEPPGAFLWRICAAGEVEQVAAFDPHGFPNDLAFGRDGRIYVTDPFLGRIWRVDDAGVSVWLEDPLFAGNPEDPALPAHHFGVDGIAFDRTGKQLYVGNLDYGRIMAISIDRNGEPADLEVFASDPSLVGVDGLAFDKAGNLYAAVNGQDALAVIDRRGKVKVLARDEPLDAPSSLVFGTRPRDKHTLYIASFAINRAVTGQEAKPALLKLRTRTPGLPLSKPPRRGETSFAPNSAP